MKPRILSLPMGPRTWLGVGLVLLMACDVSPTDTDGPTDETIIPTGRGKKGLGVAPFRTLEPAQASFEVTETWIGGHGWDLSSAPDGVETRIVGEAQERFIDWSTPGGTLVPLYGSPAVWTAATGWVPVPVHVESAYYRIERTSDAGQMAGHYQTVTATGGCCGPVEYGLRDLAFWSSDASPDIGETHPGFEVGRIGGINSLGQVVGSAGPRAMLWSPDGAGGMTTRDLHAELLAGMGFSSSSASDINDRGQVVGRAFDGYRERAFLFDGDSVQMLDGALPDTVTTAASAINNADPVQISGNMDALPGDYYTTPHGLRWTVSADSLWTEALPPPAGFEPGSRTFDITDAGQVVGHGTRPGTEPGYGGSGLLVWTETGAGIAVLDVGEDPFACARIDNYAALVGLTRVLACRRPPGWTEESVGPDLESYLYEIRVGG